MASKNSDTTPSSPEPPRPRKILVVDDSEDGAEMLATLLRFDGHEVLTPGLPYAAEEIERTVAGR